MMSPSAPWPSTRTRPTAVGVMDSPSTVSSSHPLRAGRKRRDLRIRCGHCRIESVKSALADRDKGCSSSYVGGAYLPPTAASRRGQKITGGLLVWPLDVWPSVDNCGGMPFKPVNRGSVPEDLFDQIVAEVLSGQMRPGESLPSERRLAEVLGVSRPAAREALQRLAAAGLVDGRHGDSTTVRDFRRHAGLDLLPCLLLRAGELDLTVARSVLEAPATQWAKGCT